MAGGRTDPAAVRRATIERQLTAMGADRYVLGVHHRAEDRMWRLANLTAGQVLEHERLLAGLNMRGRDIYLAPVRNAGLILIDDLPAATLARLRADGLAPAVTVETSPANFQAWVRVAPAALPRDLATAVSRELAVRYGGDRGSVGSEHLGRMAGYTNQKPSRTLPDGRQPWVRLHDAGGQPAPAADQLLDDMRARLEAGRGIPPAERGPAVGARAWEVLDTRPAREGAAGPPLTPEYLAHEFAVRSTRVLERQRARGDRLDHSAADWAVVGTLHERYPWLSTAQLAQAMRQGSPRLEERHAGHVAEYVGRTVVKAVQAAEARAGPTRSPGPEDGHTDGHGR